MSRRSRKLFDITVEYVHRTDKALLFNDGKQDFWVPKSIMGDDGIVQVEPNEDGSINLTAPEWWLTERGLI